MNLPRRFSLGLLLVPLLLGRPAAAQLPDPSFSAPTSLYAPGTIYSLGPQQTDGKRLVSGSFTRVNGAALASRLVRFDAAGALDQPFLQNIGSASTVFRIVGLPNGQYLLSGSGNYVTAGGLTRAELLRLNANGTADATFDAGSGPSGAAGFNYGQAQAVQPDGKVVVVGYFDSFSGTPALGVVRLNPNGSVDTGFSVGTGIDLNNGSADAVVVQPDGKILVGGYFDTFNGQPANGLVRLNANGSVDASFIQALQPGSEVIGLVLQPDGKLLANGYLTLNNPSNLNPGLVRLLPGGTLDSSFGAPAYLSTAVAGYDDPAVLLQPDGKILVIGYFNGAGTNYVTRLNPNGAQDASFQAGNGLSGTPNTIGLQANGSIILGGNFDSLNGTETPLGRLTSTGAPDTDFVPKIQISGSVSALVLQPDGKLVLGGNFTELNEQPVHRLARLTPTGALEAGFSAATGTLPGPVSSLALQADGKVLAGTTRGLLRLAGSGSPDPDFTSGLNTAGITALALQPDGRVLVGGFFSGTTSAGTPYSRLARLTSTGSLDPTFARNTSGTVSPGFLTNANAIVVQSDGRIVMGGTFRVTNQPTAARVVRYETTGASDASFAPPLLNNPNSANGLTSRVYSLAVQPDGKILAGGSFVAVNGTSQPSVARLTATGALDASFAANAPVAGTVFALARQPNGRVLLGGSFTSTGPTASLSNLTRVLDTGQADVSFGPSTTPNGPVRALVVQPDGAILLAGGFTTVGGQPNVGLARIVATNVLAVAAPAAVAARTAAWPVPAHGLLHVAPDANAQLLTVELLDALGRPVRTHPATTAAEITLNLENLPAGMYLLRVRYAAGVVTRRIAIQ